MKLPRWMWPGWGWRCFTRVKLGVWIQRNKGKWLFDREKSHTFRVVRGMEAHVLTDGQMGREGNQLALSDLCWGKSACLVWALLLTSCGNSGQRFTSLFTDSCEPEQMLQSMSSPRTILVVCHTRPSCKIFTLIHGLILWKWTMCIGLL